MNTDTNLTYPERGAALTAQQRTELDNMFVHKCRELKILMETSRFSAVSGVNVAREIGLQIELFTGTQKLSPAAYEKTALAQLPDVTLEFAKECLAAHHRFPEPVTTYQQAAPVWDRLLIQAALLEVAGRSGPQQRHLHEPVKDFLCKLISAKSSWVALEKEMPIEKWEQFYCDSFLREIQPLHELYERAVKRKAGK